ncbi:MAG: ATP-binding protein [Cyanobacteria bacterium P01_F01_bin.86]
MAQFSDHSALAIRTLPFYIYATLRRSLLEHGNQPNSILFTEAELPSSWLATQRWTELLLVITPTMQSLLVWQRDEVLTVPDEPSVPGAQVAVSVGMMTAPQGLIAVMADLLQEDITEPIQQQLGDSQQQLRDRPASCPDLVLSLLPGLTGRDIAPIPDATKNTHAIHLPVQKALDQQLEQGLLLNQVITKIRQSLDLESILSTTVEEVRPFLAADRLLIYQFKQRSTTEAEVTERQAIADAKSQQQNLLIGYITYESRTSEDISSVLDCTEGHCFKTGSQSHEYLMGRPIAVQDIQEYYSASPCLLSFLQKANVRAELIAPIIVRDELWGFLIAHHCHTPRQWQPQELIFLQHIAEHLSIAVQQAELYEQLQEQAHSLEACITNQTQDLRDALTAAQSANLAKSEFLATMSHELRTPLTCIMGMSATLLRWSFGELSPRQRDYLTTIHQSGDRLLAIINDILEMAKIESGRTVLEVSPFSLTQLAQKALEPFRQQARDRDIELTFEPTLLPEQDTFTGDPRRVQQILDNLLSNALKFTADEGQVNLRLRRENHMAVLQVEDTGIGIPESQMPLLFEKFQQLETSRQRRYPGTGLGLALTKQLAELHGGSIAVNSRVGVGSVFTVRLPLQRQENEITPTHAPVDLPPATPVVGRIVLVEDQEDTAGMICDLLTAADYQVIWVIDGSQVVEQVALLKPTVVILNRQLNSVNSSHIIQSLRESLVTAPIKILALSSDQETPLLTTDADETIFLPLDPEILLQRVNALVVMTTA